MPFFRISVCDENALETEVLRELKNRYLPRTGDTELLGEFNRRHSSICRLLRQTDQERARLALHITGLNEAVAIKDEHLATQYRHIERQNKHIIAQEEEIGALKSSRDGLENVVEDHKKHIELIHNTLSWRIMKPIRLMKQLLTKRSS